MAKRPTAMRQLLGAAAGAVAAGAGGAGRAVAFALMDLGVRAAERHHARRGCRAHQVHQAGDQGGTRLRGQPFGPRHGDIRQSLGMPGEPGLDRFGRFLVQPALGIGSQQGRLEFIRQVLGCIVILALARTETPPQRGILRAAVSP